MTLIVGDVDTSALAAELKTFLADSMPTSLDGVTGDLDDWIDANEERLGDWLDQLLDRLGDWVDTVSETLSDANADRLGDWLDNLEADLEGFLEIGLEALDDLIDGTRDAEEIHAGDGDDKVVARGGDDLVFGGDGEDLLRGGGGRDDLSGDADDDKLIGGGGRDTLDGGTGDDILTGGRGKDIMDGGAGADCFVFRSIKDSAAGKRRDEITFDESDGDEIDLRLIDAREDLAGDQEFSWIGDQDFSGEAGELRFSSGILRGDVDGDGVADFSIAISGSISADDFLF